MGWLALVLRIMNHTAARSNLKVVGRSAWPRPAGLGFFPFWLNFVYVALEFKYSPKLVKLVNVSENHNKIVLKA